jgi:hypothetical protein
MKNLVNLLNIVRLFEADNFGMNLFSLECPRMTNLSPLSTFPTL